MWAIENKEGFNWGEGMKYFSAFSGIGGFELGIQKAYESNTKRKSKRTKPKPKERTSGGVGAAHKHDKMLRTPDGTTPLCIGYSEIDRYAIQIYEKHFPEHTNFRDITKITASSLPDFDLFVGGFPCQAFSIAGKRKGFDDTRGTLFFDIARILKEKRPRYILLENVKGLLSHDNGNTYRTILSTLIGIGYDIQAMVLNAKDFGVPQNRERVFIAGCLGGFGGRKVFSFGGSEQKGLELNEITENASQGYRVYGTDGISPTQASQAGGVGAKTGLIMAPTIRATSYKKGDNDTLIARTVRSGGRKSPHGSKQNWDSYEVKGKIRRLTPLEAERLMGFSDGWTEGVSDTQRYKTLGNGIVSNVVAAVIKNLLTPLPQDEVVE